MIGYLEGTLLKTGEDRILVLSNQIGYEIHGPKRFMISDSESRIFEIINESGDVSYKGELAERGTWESAGEMVKMGDFSTFDDPGTYRIRVKDEGMERTICFLL